MDTSHLPEHITLYYPGAGFDVSPLRAMAGVKRVEAIYVDYGLDRQRVETEFLPAMGPQTIESIDSTQLGAASWAQLWAPNPRAHEAGNPADAFALRARGTTQFPFELDLTYARTEGVGTLARLIGAGRAPKLIVLQDHGFGGNWAKFGRGGALERAARGSPPEFLIVGEGTTPWDGYEQIGPFVTLGGDQYGSARALFARTPAYPA